MTRAEIALLAAALLRAGSGNNYIFSPKATVEAAQIFFEWLQSKDDSKEFFPRDADGEERF